MLQGEAGSLVLGSARVDIGCPCRCRIGTVARGCEGLVPRFGHFSGVFELVLDALIADDGSFETCAGELADQVGVYHLGVGRQLSQVL